MSFDSIIYFTLCDDKRFIKRIGGPVGKSEKVVDEVCLLFFYVPTFLYLQGTYLLFFPKVLSCTRICFSGGGKKCGGGR